MAQQQAIDSLLHITETSKDDSVKALAFYKLATSTYQKDPRKALDYIAGGQNLAQQRSLAELSIDFLNVEGVIYQKLKEYDKSIRTHFKVLRIRENRKDNYGAALSLMNIGNVFNVEGDWDEALNYYKQSLNYAIKAKKEPLTANLYNNIANIYSQRALESNKKTDIKIALKYLHLTGEYIKKNRLKNDLSTTYALMGYVYLADSNLRESEAYARKAISIATRDEYYGTLCYARICLGNVLVNTGRFEPALKEAQLTKKIIMLPGQEHLKEEFETDIRLIEEAVEKKRKDLVLQNTSQDNAKELDLARQRLREELKAKYEAEKRELANKNLQLQNKAIADDSKRNRLLALVIGIFALSFGTLLLVLAKKNKKLQTERNKLAEANCQIKEQAEKIMAQNDSLQEAERFKSRLFSVVSHDLKAPINSFKSILSLSKIMDIEPNELKNMLIQVGHDVDIAASMLDELLLWSSGQMEKEQMQWEWLMPWIIVDNCQMLFRDRIALKKLNVCNHLPLGIKVWGDLKRGEFIIRNLLSNAIKFSYEGKTIDVGIVKEQDYLKLYIKDQGMGMSGQVIDQFKKHATKRYSQPGTFQEKGSGIGLFLCEDFAKSMGWQLYFESQEGIGTIFYISIPIPLEETVDELTMQQLTNLEMGTLSKDL